MSIIVRPYYNRSKWQIELQRIYLNPEIMTPLHCSIHVKRL